MLGDQSPRPVLGLKGSSLIESELKTNPLSSLLKNSGEINETILLSFASTFLQGSLKDSEKKSLKQGSHTRRRCLVDQGSSNNFLKQHKISLKPLYYFFVPETLTKWKLTRF